MDDNAIFGYYNIGDREVDIFDQNKIDSAKQWSQSADRTIIIPTDDLNTLEKNWLQYNSMIKKHRRESDWKCLELFGVTNKDLYEKIRSSIISKDFPNYFERDSIENIITPNDVEIDVVSTNESAIDDTPAVGALASYYNLNSGDTIKDINFTDMGIRHAKEWADSYDRIIIIPTNTLEELENLWEAFNSMIKKHRRESDWKSLELFEATNYDSYNYLKSKFLAEDLSDEKKRRLIDIESVSESAIHSAWDLTDRYCKSNISNIPRIDIYKRYLDQYQKNNTIFEEVQLKDSAIELQDICNGNDTIETTPDIISTYQDLPIISPEEMIDMGVFGQASSDNYYNSYADDLLAPNISVQEWFRLYKDTCNGYYNEFNSLIPIWTKRVRELTFNLEQMINKGSNEEEINWCKQSILELGWDPDIPFDNKNRKLASMMFKERAIKIKTHNYDINRLKSFREADELVISNTKQELFPVYLFLFESRLLDPNVMKVIYGRQIANMGISIDPNFQRICCFNDKLKCHEVSIDRLGEGQNINIDVIFLKEDRYNKVIELLKNFNDINTSYIYDRAIKYMFSVQLSNEISSMTAEFADRIMTVIDKFMATDKDEVNFNNNDQVYENDDTRYVYNLYKGSIKSLSTDSLDKTIKSLLNRAHPIKESFMSIIDYYKLDEANYISGVSNNIDNIDIMYNLKENINIVSTPQIKSIIMSIFENIEVKPYRDYENLKYRNKSDLLKLESISNFIRSFVRPI